MGAGLVDATAREDDRPGGRGEGAHHGLRIGGSRRGSMERDLEDLVERRRPGVAGQVLFEDVIGDAQVDRPGAPVIACRAASSHESRNVGGHGRLDAPLGDRREQRGLLELLVLAAIAIRAAHGRHQGHDRAAGPERFGQTAGDVRGTWPVRPVDEGRCAPEASVAVGHVDRGRFAAGEHLVDTGGFESDPEAIVPAGHQEEVLDSESLHLLGDRGRRLECDCAFGDASGAGDRRG